MRSTVISIFLSLGLVSSSAALACSIFLDPYSNQVAHNVDWMNTAPNVKGIFVLNPAGLIKKATVYNPAVKTAEWVSKFRNLTFSIAGAEFPVAGFNENGLFMAILMLPEAGYLPDNDPRLPMNPSQFVQYNLDLSSSIQDVIASVNSVRPMSKMVNMHYMACDKTSKCVVIQYINGELAVYDGNTLPFPALTNSAYPKSQAAANECLGGKCDSADNSLWRFGKVVALREQLQPGTPFEVQGMTLLDQVVQSVGNTTRFQLSYDPASSRMTFRNRGANTSAFIDVDLNQVKCLSAREVIPLDGQQGDLKGKWQPLTEKLQYDMVIGMGMPDALAKLAARYPFEAKCQE